MTIPPLDAHYVPTDSAIAQAVFGANCGPISLAAVLGEDVCDIMCYFPHFLNPNSRFTNLSSMKRALKSCGEKPRQLRQEFPTHGVALIQWLGPWTDFNLFSKWSLSYSHWIAISRDHVFDYFDDIWRPMDEWVDLVVPEYLREIPGATGWTVKFGLEVEKGSCSWQTSFFSTLLREAPTSSMAG